MTPGRDRWSLLPWRALGRVVKVFEHGARKYAPDGWKVVPQARTVYFNATMRHLAAWWDGEAKDPETGESPLAHAAADVLILLALELMPPAPPPARTMRDMRHKGGFPRGR